MVKETLMFENIEIEKRNYHHQTPVPLRDVGIEKILVSNKISFGEKKYKYFIGYLYNDHKFNSLDKVLLKTSARVKCYDGQTKWI